VKPANILVTPDGSPKLVDFGLAKPLDKASMHSRVVGTPYYMSPEQAALTSRPVDQRSDVYSFGVTLYEACCGRRPYEGATVYAVLEAIQSRVPEPLRQRAPHASAGLAAVVRRAMERDPADRYPSALDLAADLTALAEGRATQALAQEGGAWMRVLRAFRQGWGGQLAEFRSDATFLGLPLVHVFFNRRTVGQRRRVAKGWLAAGDVAIGGLAFGGIAVGGLSFGGIGMGLITWAGLATGLFPLGGLSVGGYATGGVAVGYAAFGGMAAGQYAMGGSAYGTYAVGGNRRDPEAIEWFRENGVPWMAFAMGGPRARMLLDPPREPAPPAADGAPADGSR
jgi:hypothetical protein